ncbi:MAG TPA: tetratricopeptide repeat protein, partial [Chthonomonadaceae bacterium]|nr:tetratricopeptide repeat protein [Chthonomonadaceae bacterium]
ERAGISPRSLSEIERGGPHQPRRDTVALLAGALGLDESERAALEQARQRQAAPALRGGDDNAPRPPIPLEAGPPPRSNLPLALSSFIGREHEQAEVRALLEAARLVTLTGTGGVGKTRLALAVAAELAEGFANGVWLVELAALADPALVSHAVARAVGLREEPGRAVQDTLAASLRPRHLLLVLDNCEHLLPACAELADTLLHVCPQLQILTTSREGMHIAGESLYRVPSLSLPVPELHPTPASLYMSEAARLFIERAMAVRPDFAVTDTNAAILASVCHRLDGIPLAMELAAARARSLTLEEIHTRLNHGFALLTGGNRMALPRQQTLRATIDWSYALLTEPERLLLHRLSVFAGGWTVETAEQVCADEEAEEDFSLPNRKGKIAPAEILDLLTSLVDKSLGVAELHTERTRYRMLETVRQYGAEKLRESGEEAEYKRRHCVWCLTLAEAAAPKLTGPEQGEWLQRLEREYDNLQAALFWSLQIAEGRDADPQPSAHRQIPLRLCAALGQFWRMRGHLEGGRSGCEAALKTEEAQERTVALAQTWGQAGALADLQGDFHAARTYFAQGLEIFQEIGDRKGIAISLGNMGSVAHGQGDYTVARAYFEQSLELCREVGDRKGIANALGNLGIVASNQNDYVSARAYFAQSLELCRELGNRSGIAQMLGNMGVAANRQGDYAAARDYFEQSQEIKRELGDRQGLAYGFINLGVIANDQSDYAAARAYYEQSLETFQEIGDRKGIAYVLGNLGVVANYQGDYPTARDYQERSLEIKREVGDRMGIAHALGNLGIIANNQSDYASARAYFEQSLELCREIGDQSSIAIGLGGLGQVAFDQGDYVSAQTYEEQSLDIYKTIGHRSGIAHALGNLGRVANARCDYTAARAYCTESLTIIREMGLGRDAVYSLEYLAGALLEQGEAQKAMRLWGAAHALRQSIHLPRPPNERVQYDRQVNQARSVVGHDVFDAAWEEGQGMPWELAIEYALEGQEITAG